MKKYIISQFLLIFQLFYAQDGLLDTTFDVGSGANGNVYLMKQLPNGKVIIGGQFTSFDGNIANGIATLNSDGSFNSSFNTTNEYFRIFDALIEDNGKIILVGEFSTYNGIGRGCIVRIFSDGTIDPTFTTSSGGANMGISCISKQNDKYIISGSFTSFNGIYSNCLARLNANGTIDQTFNTNGIFSPGANGNITQNIVLPDGKILISGRFDSYQNVNRKNIARLNFDGTLDTSFNPGTGASSSVQSIGVQTDGKYIISGSFGLYDGTNKPLIARINNDGSLDNSFSIDLNDFNIISSKTIIQSDNKIIVGGWISTLNSNDEDYITRLNSDGSIDTSFITGTNFDNPINTVSFQTDGKILAGGWFSSYNGTNREKVLRLQNIFPLSVNEFSFTFVCYPNPTKNIFYLNFLGTYFEIDKVTISDIMGNVVIEKNQLPFYNQIDLSNCANGVYFVTIQNKGKTTTKKIIKN